MSRTVAMTVAYHGAPFHGWAANPGVRTVEGDLTAALTKVLRHDVTVHVAGRTDKGVHARGQVVSFATDAPHFDARLLERSVNKLCREVIAVRDTREVAADFHARFSATQRAYRYRISTGPVDPLRADQVWFCRRPLELAQLNAAAAAVPGERDFRSMCRRPPGAAPDDPLVRRVDICEWSVVGDEYVLDIAANAFCHQMVRSLVGAMVTVAAQAGGSAAMGRLLASPERAVTPAPPHGLCLERVKFGN